MTKLKVKSLFSLFSISLLSWTVAADHHGGASLLSIEEIMVGDHRSEANIARNEFRNPVETLEFFGLEPNMTLIEIGPSGAWYTEILAPYMRDHGRYYGAHFSPNSGNEFQRRSLENFEAKLAANPELYGKATVRHLLPPNELVIGPVEGADMVLTFRNVHNWMARNEDEAHFNTFFDSLKPGGILGVVEHRAPDNATRQEMIDSGYVSEAFVKQIAARSGFEFVGSSEVNANPRDTKDYAQGVWTLPPSYRLGDTDRAKYTAIGESDRMTLKFRKPL
ncbi:MAG: methyltransferase [Gammaproteobacteria bacterium]|nr:methyltransferase [Gammaproteobacteria bacterium]MDD9958339.1 methyltransferase [Gammaproteobacteria bacterium]